MSLPLIRVAAGVVFDGAGRVLIARRGDGRHGAGFWEFPGGKIQAGETPRAALDRELAEEIGIVVIAASPLLSYRHDYPERCVELHVFRVEDFRGSPRALEGQPLQWVMPGELASVGLLEADVPIVAALNSGLSGLSRS